MFKKIMCLSVIAILAISSISVCSASGPLTSYYWTLKGAQDYSYWEGYDNYWSNSSWYINQFPQYNLKNLPGESLDNKNYVMAFLQYNSYIDFRINTTLQDRTFNVIYSTGVPKSIYYINGNGIYFITIYPYNWNINS